MQTILGQKSLSITNNGVIVKSFWILIFTFLTAAGAWIEIPTKPIPFTLQTFFVLLTAAYLGAKKSAISQLTYLSLGAIGLPVFSGFSFGLTKLLGPTGGYLLSFPISAFVMGYLLSLKKNYVWTLFSMTIGILIIFIMGTIHLNLFYIQNWKQSIISGFLIFSWWDALKILAAASIYNIFSKK